MERIGQYLGYHKFGTGSIQYILKEMERITTPLGNQRITTFLAEARTAADAAAKVEYEWAMVRKSPTMTRRGAFELDNEIDSTISAIYSVIDGQEKANGPTADLAKQLIDKVFPAGAAPITSPSFEKQRSLVAQLLERLGGPYANHVQQLSLAPLVHTLDEKHRAFPSSGTSREFV